MERPTYNATIVSRDAAGAVVSTSIGYVEDGKILAAAGYWTHSIWSEGYDADYRSSRFSMVASIEIVLDGGAGYKNRLAGLVLPPAYQAA